MDSLGEARGADAVSSGREHLGALIESDDSTAMGSGELDRDGGGAGGDVEDRVLRLDAHARDEEGAPARVLPEREQARRPIVGRPERREELSRPPRPLPESLCHVAIVAPMTLEGEIAAARGAAEGFAEPDEEVVGVVPADPGAGRRVFLCAYGGESGPERWLALDREGVPVADRAVVRDAVSIAALCELAEESAGGGDLVDLRARLAELRLTENPEGIEEAEAAAAELHETLRATPRMASAAYLDAVGLAAAKLEQTLGDVGSSPFAEAMKLGAVAAGELAEQVERGYKLALA